MSRCSLEGWGCHLRSPRAGEAFPAGEGEQALVLEDRLSGRPAGSFLLRPAAGEALVCPDGERCGEPEALWLLCRLAFEQLGLAALRWEQAVPPLPERLSREAFFAGPAGELSRLAAERFRAALAEALGGLEFHHIGVATRSLEKELPVYTLLGYAPESAVFEDPAQGVRGLFITAPGHPRLELLENLPGSATLDKPLELRQKLYHTAYYVPDLDRALAIFSANRAKLLSPPKPSVYFGGRICFLTLPNLGIIELMEKR